MQKEENSLKRNKRSGNITDEIQHNDDADFVENVMKNESCKCSYKRVGLSVETASNYSEAIEENTKEKNKESRTNQKMVIAVIGLRSLKKCIKEEACSFGKKELSWLVSRINFIFSITDVYN